MADDSLAAAGVAEADDGETPAFPCEPDPGPRRRHWPLSAKARIIAEGFVPGTSVSAVAARASTVSALGGAMAFP